MAKTYAIKNAAGKYLRGGTYAAGGWGPLDPQRTMLYTSKREAVAMAEFYGHSVVEVGLTEIHRR